MCPAVLKITAFVQMLGKQAGDYHQPRGGTKSFQIKLNSDMESQKDTEDKQTAN